MWVVPSRLLRSTACVFTFAALTGTHGAGSLIGYERAGVPPPDDVMRLTELTVELDAPDTVELGRPVQITLRVRNDGGAPAALELTGRPIAFDLIVTRSNGTVVWRRLRGEIVSMVLQVAILQPNESLEFAHTWDQRDDTGRVVRAGSYLVRGELPGPDGTLASEPRRIVISGTA